MPTHSRKHSEATQIVVEILKDAAKPRQAVSVKKALRKMRPAPVVSETLRGTTEKVQPVPRP